MLCMNFPNQKNGTAENADRNLVFTRKKDMLKTGMSIALL